MKTLVDNGAAVTIMHEDLLARVRTKETQVKPATKTILGANNTPLNVTGSAEVDISVCGTTVRHDVLICNDLSQVTLIGVDYLKPHRCVVDFEKNKLKIGKHEETLLYSNDRKVCRHTSLYNGYNFVQSGKWICSKWRNWGVRAHIELRGTLQNWYIKSGGNN